MKIKDLIEKLEKMDPEEEIIAPFWEKYDFNVSQREWEEVVPLVDNEFDWDSTYESLHTYIKSFKSYK